MPRTGVRHDHILIVAVVIDYSLNTSPRILNIIEIPPHIAMLYDGGEIRLHASVDLIHGPTARIDHRPSSSVEVKTKFRISMVHVSRMGIAAVQFDVVDVPRSESISIEL